MAFRCLPFFLLVVAIGSANSICAAEVPSGFRAALLLGSSDYEGFQLQGVDHSITAVEQALKSHDFKVTRRMNLSQQDMKKAVDEFAQSVPTNGVALVYYIGLGSHVERLGKWGNFLRPPKEKIESDTDYRSRGLDVSDLIESL